MYFSYAPAVKRDLIQIHLKTMCQFGHLDIIGGKIKPAITLRSVAPQLNRSQPSIYKMVTCSD